MAEENQGQEKTEQPTEKRLLDSRKKGQVPRSRELSTMFVTLFGSMLFIATINQIYGGLSRVFHSVYQVPVNAFTKDTFFIGVFSASVGEMLLTLSLFLGGIWILSLVGPLTLGSWSFSTEALTPKFSKLNPLSGFKRMFGVNSAMELFKAILKVALVGSIASLYFYIEFPSILQIADQPILAAIQQSVQLMLGALLSISFGLLLIAAVDVPFQLWNFKKKLRMTKQEIKDEMKETDGNPESKSRVRNMQREIAQRRMLEAIPEADVIIVNPTHYSVVLKYDSDEHGAPVVVAKGIDHIALKIREIGVKHRVTIFSAPMLARAVYYSTKLDQPIPSGLYLAVAKVLAYVFQLKNAKPGQLPEPPTDLSVPQEFQHE